MKSLVMTACNVFPSLMEIVLVNSETVYTAHKYTDGKIETTQSLQTETFRFMVDEKGLHDLIATLTEYAEKFREHEQEAK